MRLYINLAKLDELITDFRSVREHVTTTNFTLGNLGNIAMGNGFL